MKWISTKERLPEEGQRVLYVKSNLDEVLYGEFYKEKDGRLSFGDLLEGYVSLAYVVYWMPLPAPPSEEEVREEKEFKVGMKVRVVKNRYEGVWPRRDEECPIGCVFLVKLIKIDGYRGKCEKAGVEFKPFIKVCNGWEFHPDELEIVEDE